MNKENALTIAMVANRRVVSFIVGLLSMRFALLPMLSAGVGGKLARRLASLIFFVNPLGRWEPQVRVWYRLSCGNSSVPEVLRVSHGMHRRRPGNRDDR